MNPLRELAQEILIHPQGNFVTGRAMSQVRRDEVVRLVSTFQNALFSAEAGMESRRADLERIADMAVRVHKITGFFLVQGTGRAEVIIDFPILFVEKPALSWGSSLAEGDRYDAKAFPSFNAVVTNWGTQQAGDSGERYYRSAKLALSIAGSKAQRMWVNWHAEGRGLRNPVDPAMASEQPIDSVVL